MSGWSITFTVFSVLRCGLGVSACTGGEDVGGTSVPCAFIVVFSAWGASAGLKAFKPSGSTGTGRGGESDTVAGVSAGAVDVQVMLRPVTSFINVAYAQKKVYPNFYTHRGIYKKRTWWETVRSSTQTLTHAYAHNWGKEKLHH